MSEQGTAGNRKCITLMVPQKLERTRRPESGKSQRLVMASYKTGSLSMIYRNGRLITIVLASSENSE